jgi:hypothetical protein
MCCEQELKAILQIHSIPEEAREEILNPFKKSNLEHHSSGWREGYYYGELGVEEV